MSETAKKATFPVYRPARGVGALCWVASTDPTQSTRISCPRPFPRGFLAFSSPAPRTSPAIALSGVNRLPSTVAVSSSHQPVNSFSPLQNVHQQINIPLRSATCTVSAERNSVDIGAGKCLSDQSTQTDTLQQLISSDGSVQTDCVDVCNASTGFSCSDVAMQTDAMAVEHVTTQTADQLTFCHVSCNTDEYTRNAEVQTSYQYQSCDQEVDCRQLDSVDLIGAEQLTGVARNLSAITFSTGISNEKRHKYAKQLNDVFEQLHRLNDRYSNIVISFQQELQLSAADVTEQINIADDDVYHSDDEDEEENVISSDTSSMQHHHQQQQQSAVQQVFTATHQSSFQQQRQSLALDSLQNTEPCTDVGTLSRGLSQTEDCRVFKLPEATAVGHDKRMMPCDSEMNASHYGMYVPQCDTNSLQSNLLPQPVVDTDYSRSLNCKHLADDGLMPASNPVQSTDHIRAMLNLNPALTRSITQLLIQRYPNFLLVDPSALQRAVYQELVCLQQIQQQQQQTLNCSSVSISNERKETALVMSEAALKTSLKHPASCQTSASSSSCLVVADQEQTLCDPNDVSDSTTMQREAAHAGDRKYQLCGPKTPSTTESKSSFAAAVACTSSAATVVTTACSRPTETLFAQSGDRRVGAVSLVSFTMTSSSSVQRDDKDKEFRDWVLVANAKRPKKQLLQQTKTK